MIFVDTSALYALSVATDPRHEEAVGALRELVEEPLVTHDYVAVECVSLLQARHGLDAVRGFVDHQLPALELRPVPAWLRDAALQAVVESGRRGVSLVDHTSFLLMRQLGVERAFAFDPDFAREGFLVMPG